MLGECLRGVPRDKFVLMTKAGRYASKDGGPSKSDFSEGTIRASIDDSLDRLGVEYVDVMNLHDVEFAGSLDQVINEALPALVEAKAAGKVRHIGITGLPLGVLDYCVERSGEAGIDVECILSYCCYTLNCTTLELNLPRWKHRGIGVVQGGATSMGLLTPGGPQDWHPAPAVVKEVCKRAVDVCQSQLGENIIKLEETKGAIRLQRIPPTSVSNQRVRQNPLSPSGRVGVFTVEG